MSVADFRLIVCVWCVRERQGVLELIIVEADDWYTGVNYAILSTSNIFEIFISERKGEKRKERRKEERKRKERRIAEGGRRESNRRKEAGRKEMQVTN